MCDGLEIGEYYQQVGGWGASGGRYRFTFEKYDLKGCTNPQAVNYNACATEEDGSCNTCTADLDSNGVINVGDLLLFMALFGGNCN